jgi:hypothetical protein
MALRCRRVGAVHRIIRVIAIPHHNPAMVAVTPLTDIGPVNSQRYENSYPSNFVHEFTNAAPNLGFYLAASPRNIIPNYGRPVALAKVLFDSLFFHENCFDEL